MTDLEKDLRAIGRRLVEIRKKYGLHNAHACVDWDGCYHVSYAKDSGEASKFLDSCDAMKIKVPAQLHPDGDRENNIHP